jgi:DNA-directed RNA polymerase subunit beta
LQIGQDIPGNDYPTLKKLKLSRRSYQIPIYGKATLIDKATGKVIDQIDKFKLANVPKMTRWYSMIIDGNEYQTVNQLRLKSGVYTRVKDNGDLESRFNLERGFNFTMILPPDKGIIYLVTRHAKYRLYNILSALGMSDEKILAAWGKELFDKNRRGAKNSEQLDIIQLAKELTKVRDIDFVGAIDALKKYFDNTRMSPETTKITLGAPYDRVSLESLLATSKKLIEVMRGNQPPDERESLIFKDLYSVEDLATQYFEKNKETLVNKIKFRMDKKNSIRDIISSATYSKPIKSFFTQSDLASTSEQTNPAQILANAQKVTFMGTGGIGSRHAITTEVRDLHPTHINFLDALATPESSRAGVNLGLTRDLLKDGHTMKTPVRMPSGERKFISVADYYNMKIAFPDQYAIVNRKPVPIKRRVKAMYQGKTVIIPASEVDAYMFSPSNLFSYTTNLIPYISHNSGNRIAMATRMLGQAIPIVGREAPYVQTR